MRTLVFTLFAIAAGTVVQFGLSHLPYSVDHALGKFILVFMFALPVAVTVGLARVTRIWNWYVVLLAVLSPIVTAILEALFSVSVLHERFFI